MISEKKISSSFVHYSIRDRTKKVDIALVFSSKREAEDYIQSIKKSNFDYYERFRPFKVVSQEVIRTEWEDLS